MESLLNTENLYELFGGAWSIERYIYIKQSGQLHATAHGEAFFKTVNGKRIDLKYREQGKLRLASGNTDISFTRSFLYQFPDSSTMDVYFGDGPDNGSLYQTYIFKSPDKFVAEHIHHCGNDEYEGVYEFSNTNIFELTTIIAGPTKDFLIKTIYSR